MKFEWDKNKNISNTEKHKINFVDAVRVFDGFYVHQLGDGKDHGEERFVITGILDNKTVTVVYTMRNNVRRLISARRASPKERFVYHEQAK